MKLEELTMGKMNWSGGDDIFKKDERMAIHAHSEIRPR